MKTEREEFEEWWEDNGVGYSSYEDFALMAWQAGRAPLLKRIEELEEQVKHLELNQRTMTFDTRTQQIKPAST